MKGPKTWLLVLFLAPVLTVACGVPISAADLALTPEATPTAEESTVVAVTSSSVGSNPSSDTSVRALSSTAITPQASATAQTSGTARATSTAALSATQAGTATATRTPTPAGTPLPTETPSRQPSDMAADALTILNKYRTDSGRQPLKLDPALVAAANAYAKTLADNNWFYCGCDFHTGPDGSQPDQRVYAAGYTGRWKGEAIAGGQSSGQQAITTWLNSPPHAAIVLDPNATEVGIGYFYKAGDLYGHYWVLTTGTH
jgi:uncharacterized protein YkwD